MIKESSKPSKEVNVKNSLADANGISRQSMNLLAGDENDLLSDSLVSNKPPANKGKAIDQGGFPRQNLPVNQVKPIEDEEFE